VTATSIYIKCHSRAAYLDRCIRSIKRNVAGHGPIMLLNDGIAGRYLDRLTGQHPDIQVRHSLKVTAPPADPVALDGPAYDPAKFWVSEIEKDPGAHVVILEEDTWFTHAIDLPLIMLNLAANDVAILRLCWNMNPKMAEIGETVFWTILGPDSRIRYYSTAISQLLDGYKVFSISQSIFRKDYWCHCYRDVPHWTFEKAVISRAIGFLQQRQAAGERMRFCDLGREVVRPSFASTGRVDSGGQGVAHKIDHKACNAALDEAWLAGAFDPMADYPDDFSDATRLAAFQGRLTEAQIGDWMKWRADYTGMYRRMGAAIA